MFLSQACKYKLSDDELADIVVKICMNPQDGDIIKGTGGACKLRYIGRGKGKSRGYRTIHYYAAADVPVFLLSFYSKGHKVNLSKAECNELSRILPQLADAYRQYLLNKHWLINEGGNYDLW